MQGKGRCTLKLVLFDSKPSASSDIGRELGSRAAETMPPTRGGILNYWPSYMGMETPLESVIDPENRRRSILVPRWSLESSKAHQPYSNYRMFSVASKTSRCMKLIQSIKHKVGAFE